MGIQFKDLMESEEISLKDLSGKIVVVDSFNVLYQFLTTIRQPDGTPLMDSDGNITSHLAGLFYRTSALLKANLRLVFVFDGEPPELKKEEREKRNRLKSEAHEKYKIAKERKDFSEMKKYASRSVKITKEIIDESKELLRAFGLPVIQAPSEGEAQAAHIVKNGDAYATISQDYDTLLYSSPRLIKNLTISRRRKKQGTLSYQSNNPEQIDLGRNLQSLGIDVEQLTVLAMLIGTDYNNGGIKGIGPKHGLKLVKEHGHDFDSLFSEAKWDDFFSFPWKTVFETFRKMPVLEDYELSWSQPNHEQIMQILCKRHGFNEERIRNSLKELQEASNIGKQKSLFDF
jgi:flap endonuclease-1